MELQAPVLLGLLPLLPPPPIEGEGQGGEGFEQLFQESMPEEGEVPLEEPEEALIVDGRTAFFAEISPLKQLAQTMQTAQGTPRLELVPNPGEAAPPPAEVAPDPTLALDTPSLDAVLDQLMNPPPASIDAEVISPAVKVDVSDEAVVDAPEVVATTAPLEGVERPAEVLERAVEAAAEAPELAAPAPDVVRVRIDKDLDVEVIREPNGIGVILDGAVEAVESLSDIGSDLRESLAQGGFELNSFEKRHRDGESEFEPTFGSDGEDGEAAPEAAPKPRVRLGTYLDRMA
jgi:hypothetical protein